MWGLIVIDSLIINVLRYEGRISLILSPVVGLDLASLAVSPRHVKLFHLVAWNLEGFCHADLRP